MNKKSLNTIDWDKIKLYHGTNSNYLKSILTDGFFIPKRDSNWLGRGTYFAVNNIFMPILYSFNHAKSNGGHPIIIEIEGKYICNKIKNKILDLTSQKGLNIFHNVSKDFSNFILPYNEFPDLVSDLNLYEKHYNSSPFYNDKLKPNLLPNLKWFLLAIGSKEISDEIEEGNDIIIDKIKDLSSNNITNIIFDWFNYKNSCGFDKEVPLRGIMGNFNSGKGTPILLSNIMLDKKFNRGFADYISFLNRTEVSIFGYDYYKNNNQYWKFENIFENRNPKKNTHYKTYSGKGPIINLLRKSFNDEIEFGFELSEKELLDLYNLIINEQDTN